MTQGSRKRLGGQQDKLREVGAIKVELGLEFKVNAGEIPLRVTPQSCGLIQLHYSFREWSSLTLQSLLRQLSGSAEHESNSFLISPDCSQHFHLSTFNQF